MEWFQTMVNASVSPGKDKYSGYYLHLPRLGSLQRSEVSWFQVSQPIEVSFKTQSSVHSQTHHPPWFPRCGSHDHLRKTVPNILIP